MGLASKWVHSVIVTPLHLAWSKDNLHKCVCLCVISIAELGGIHVQITTSAPQPDTEIPLFDFCHGWPV